MAVCQRVRVKEKATDMGTALIAPAEASFFGIPTVIFSVFILIFGIGIFTYIIVRRIAPLLNAAADPRLDRIMDRAKNTVRIAIFQYRQPRYLFAGILHILIFAGFVIISLRSITLVMFGIFEDFSLPGFEGALRNIYDLFKDLAATIVFGSCVIAAIRRGFFQPERYSVPPKYGKGHTGEAILVLFMISGLMVSDAIFEGSSIAAQIQKGFGIEIPIPGTITGIAAMIFIKTPLSSLQNIHLVAYFSHELIFFFFLCFLPLGKHFHVITSIPNVFFMKLNKGTVKSVKWGMAEEKIETLESFGVKKFEDFTWKHMLDFYSCADCGRCSDNCPATAVGRPLSPRFISIKCRDYAFDKYPLYGASVKGSNLIGHILKEDEIWSCTTCGACEEECPLMIEYIDKIVDVRRGLVDGGIVPQSLQKPLSALEKRGNPYGKMERKRADWTKNLMATNAVKILKKDVKTDTLYFVDSITSYDDRIQAIGQAVVRVLHGAGVDFGILGPAEKDSGHEVKRFGEETLFLQLRDQNIASIRDSGVKNIITADPHAFNALKNDYNGIPPVEHIGQVMKRYIDSGKIRLKPIEDNRAVYTYHDPCYLGRHNGIYDASREVMDAIAGIKRVEMVKCRDRSFCCGGGGLMLFYEPIEETRMGRLRVEMAKDAGATVIVTACPFCMVNIEDAIKTTGMEGKMEVIDLVELVDRHMIA